MFDVNTSLIRHWESQFSILRPKRNKKGNRLFSPEDVENLKMIYHLVKERGMTLEGAKKALRKAPSESGVDRDAELMERLQRIRALLVEVREDLKAGEGEIVTASDADMTDADAAADVYHFILDKMVDTRPGSEWFWQTDKYGTPTHKPIVEPWKCPYRNGRMCMELMRRNPDVNV